MNSIILISIAICSILLPGNFCVVNKNWLNASIKTVQNETSEKYTTTASGLKYVDMEEGIGRMAKKGDKVVIHYNGYLENGKKFDSTYDKDEPFEFILGSGQVIKGMDEGILSMKANGKRKIIIPAKLAYGEKGLKNSIPPNSTLIFEIELLSIRPQIP
jgi:peptidylprolyl isomerase